MFDYLNGVVVGSDYGCEDDVDRDGVVAYRQPLYLLAPLRFQMEVLCCWCQYDLVSQDVTRGPWWVLTHWVGSYKGLV